MSCFYLLSTPVGSQISLWNCFKKSSYIKLLWPRLFFFNSLKVLSPWAQQKLPNERMSNKFSLRWRLFKACLIYKGFMSNFCTKPIRCCPWKKRKTSVFDLIQSQAVINAITCINFHSTIHLLRSWPSVWMAATFFYYNHNKEAIHISSSLLFGWYE